MGELTCGVTGSAGSGAQSGCAGKRARALIARRYGRPYGHVLVARARGGGAARAGRHAGRRLGARRGGPRGGGPGRRGAAGRAAGRRGRGRRRSGGRTCPTRTGPAARTGPVWCWRCAGERAVVAKITSKYHDERAGVIPLPPGAVGDAQGRASFLETDELREVPVWEFRGGWVWWTRSCGTRSVTWLGLEGSRPVGLVAPSSTALISRASRPLISPELALQRLDRFLRRRRRVDARRQVLPAAVGHDEHDVRALARLDGLVADADRRVQGRAGGDAREDALLLEEFAGAGDRVGRADGEAGRQDGGVVQLGYEALVEVARP